ncbi:MAG: hypothetical protein [Vetruanivirus porcinprimi]|jgi:hypothetical protein|uniref:Uncharacterized protein n=2 Tax=Caudoviricetes code 15 clade TaxID=3068822 RepID=A0ABZ0Z587_9CAUD|nr:MAG: hypothetical protein [phage Lak_Megaphage_RVC_AP1_GC26]
MSNEQEKQLYDKINEIIDSINKLKTIILTQENKIRLLEIKLENLENEL